MKKKSKPSLIERLRMKKIANDWAAVKRQSFDPERFETSYPEWLELFESALQDLQAVNQFPLRVILKPEEYVAWCSEHAKPLDAASRADSLAID